MRKLGPLACLLPLLAVLSGCALAPRPEELVLREHPAPVVEQTSRWNSYGTWEGGYWRW